MVFDLKNKIDDKQIKTYIQKYGEANKNFALIKVSGESMSSSLGVIVDNLVKLQDLGLTPILTHGYGTQLTKLLNKNGVTSQFIDGNRVTDELMLGFIQEVLFEQNCEFSKLANLKGLNFFNFLNSNLISANKYSEDLGFVGNITEIDLEKIISCCEGGFVPIVPPIGFSSDGVMLNINADNVANFIVEKINPLKYIVLNELGGIYDEYLIKKISINDDYGNLISNGIVSGGMKKKLVEGKNLMDKMDINFSIQIVSPDYLESELFSYSGFGTKIVSDYDIGKYEDFFNLDMNQIKSLLEFGFGKNLSKDYFSNLNLEFLLLEEDYDGVAIVEKFGDFHYLNKLVVNPDLGKTGLGKKLLTNVIDEVKSYGGNLFWKCSHNNVNNSNGFYKNYSQWNDDISFFDYKDYTFYGVGDDISQNEGLLELALNKKDFSDAPIFNKTLLFYMKQKSNFISD